MATVSVRYIVDDVDAAIAFYTRHLGFEEVMHPAPTFAMLSRGDLRLALSAPSGAGGGGQSILTARSPSPAAGTASPSRSATSAPQSTGCERRAFTSATTLSLGLAGSRSSSSIHPATRSSCSNPP